PSGRRQQVRIVSDSRFAKSRAAGTAKLVGIPPSTSKNRLRLEACQATRRGNGEAGRNPTRHRPQDFPDATRRKRPCLLTRGILHHYNARHHAARLTKEKNEEFRWQLFKHPPHRPDFSPSDYHPLGLLQLLAGGTRFETDADAEPKWLRQMSQDFYVEGIGKT
ncbi:hypothetical protein AVEN_2168-1, partial [Araneus ventricosus]